MELAMRGNAIAETKTFALSMVRVLQVTWSTKPVTTTTGDTKTYIGMTEHEFKTRYNNHKLSFRDRKHSHSTVLSKHIWDLKDSNTDYQINWRIIKRANAYRGNPSRCNLCLSEKLCILSACDISLLNKKSELVSKCRHENKFFATTNQNRCRSNRS